MTDAPQWKQFKDRGDGILFGTVETYPDGINRDWCDIPKSLLAQVQMEVLLPIHQQLKISYNPYGTDTPEQRLERVFIVMKHLQKKIKENSPREEEQR